MKHVIATVYVGLGLCSAAFAAPYFNYGTGPVPLQINATSFYNAGVFGVDTTGGLTGLSSNVVFYVGSPVLPYTTKGTLYYTNTGIMAGTNGFIFETIGATSIQNALWFTNSGSVLGFDLEGGVPPGDPYVIGPVGGAGPWAAVDTLNQPYSSQLYVLANNIVNQGVMEVGNYGVLHLAGNNVTNSSAFLGAGAVNTGAGVLGLDPIDTTGGDTALDVFDAYGGEILANGQGFCLDPPYTYDLFWGILNGGTMNLANLAGDLPDTDGLVGIPVTTRLGGAYPAVDKFGFTPGNGDYAGYVDFYTDSTGTNFWVNIVCVNTNFFGANNIGVTVGFGGAGPPAGAPLIGPSPGGGEGEGVIIQFAETNIVDVETGQMITNAIYLLDSGFFLSSMNELQNAGTPNEYNRPSPFEITTSTPEEWADVAPGFPGPYPVDEIGQAFIYTAEQFANKTVTTANVATYGAQIGRNPERLDGSFLYVLQDGVIVPNLEAEDTLQGDVALSSPVVLPDPTNEPARIEITANNLDTTHSRMRAEGMVILNVTNLVGGSTATADYGEVNSTVGAANGSLVISNFYPTLFKRLRGDVYAWEANWVNTQTNNGPGTNNPATNAINYHLLVVDQNLQGSFLSATRNLALHGKNSITVDDNLFVINQSYFDAANLTFNGTNTFTQNAGNLVQSNMPNLKNFFVNTNGVLDVDNNLVVGFNTALGMTGPAGRAYTVNTITNFGQMQATAPLFQSAIFENDGTITADNSGSIVIQAGILDLGQALTNTTNTLQADANVYLSGATIMASNSVISAGLAGLGSLTLDATTELSDGVSGVASTNTNGVIVNNWTVTDGFSLPVKPGIGDLFGTQIHTISGGTAATVYEQAVHVWAGADRGATASGFLNNEVIGRLVLDRQSPNAILRFSAAGAKNAMYVDYLELTNLAASDYKAGLVIDPNFKIYFANCNADPTKLTAFYSNLIWVPSFAGPNSSTNVPYADSSISCLMNAAVATSTEIYFWTTNGQGIPNSANQPYILNRPNATCVCDPDNYTNCQDVGGTLQLVGGSSSAYCTTNNVDLVPGCTDCYSNYPCSSQPVAFLAAPKFAMIQQASGPSVSVSASGEGAVTPVLAQSQMVLGDTYSLTATPSNGWVFDNWTTSGLGGGINIYSNVLTFAFVSNTTITAHFVTNPFPALQGAYNGLFFETNGVNPGSSGAFSLTLASSGSFSGKLLMGPNTFSFSSKFSGSGGAQFAAQGGAQSLTVNLQLDTSGQTGQILGDVNGGTWDAALVADIAPVWTARQPSPLAGSYTMALPWETGTVSAPGGDSFGVGTVNAQGVLTMAGSLADGATFSESAPVSRGAQWPFYVYAAAGNDTVLGWVSMGKGLSGANITWSKAAGKGPLYAGGFTNVLQLEGSPWQAPGAKSPALTLADPVLILAGGGLPKALTNAVALQSYLTYAATNVTLTINPASGAVSGSVTVPGLARKQSVSGVVLQNEGSARGFFIGTNQSGSVLLQGQ